MVSALLIAFVVGGGLCVLGQLVVDVGHITAAHVMVLFVVLGAVAGGIGWYGPLVKWAGAGASVPLPGFGYTMVEGIDRATRTAGVIGLLTGGLTAAAGGIKAAILCSLAAALVFNPRS
jgi:stage V sporulation protein AE